MLKLKTVTCLTAVASFVGCAADGSDFQTTEHAPATPGESRQAWGLTPTAPSVKHASPVKRYASELLARPVASQAALNLVFVLDGMRPDLINETDTPNLYKLRREGVHFVNGHAVFPTVTRVNAPSISTGFYPETAGIVGNSIYIPEIDPTRAVTTGDWAYLKQLDELSDGHLLLVPTLAQRLAAAGKSLAAVSSGSSGSAYLLNHRAQDGVGVFVNGYLDDPEGRVAYPDSVNETVLERFGQAPEKNNTTEGLLQPTDWAEDVLREYILPDLRPDVVLNWITQPDGAHHAFGAGSPEGTLVIRNDDRNIGLILEKLAELGLYDSTNIFVVSDHGFGLYTFQVNLTQGLIDAGLKESGDSGDVVLASSSQAVSIHVEGHSRQRIRDVVRYLQEQPWTGAVFTRANQHGYSGGEAAPRGWVPGTFSLELVHLANAERGADIVATFDWSSAKNVFGIPGTDMTLTGGETGPLEGNASGHGSMSPWTVNNTWLAWGVDFKDGIVNRVPSSNVDIAPTIAALTGLDTDDFDGRVLVEALEGGPDYEKLPLETRTYMTEAHRTDYRAVIQVTEVGHQRYIDKSWRLD